jgi:hypothetical protein
MSHERDLFYLKSIHGMLKQLRDGVAFSRYRSLLGEMVLCDNIDWLDCYIAKQEKSDGGIAKPMDDKPAL